MNTQEKFAAILKLNRELESLINTHVADTAEGSNTYYTKQDVLKKQLREFLRDDFSVLNNRQILQLCSMVSSHRPVEPFSFLVTCSLLIEKAKPC